MLITLFIILFITLFITLVIIDNGFHINLNNITIIVIYMMYNTFFNNTVHNCIYTIKQRTLYIRI